MLKVLGKELNTGCECAFITKKRISEEFLEKNRILVSFVIPIGREKGEKGGKDNTGDCFVTFAVIGER
jgi:hypothetical protein